MFMDVNVVRPSYPSGEIFYFIVLGYYVSTYMYCVVHLMLYFIADVTAFGNCFHCMV